MLRARVRFVVDHHQPVRSFEQQVDEPLDRGALDLRPDVYLSPITAGGDCVAHRLRLTGVLDQPFDVRGFIGDSLGDRLGSGRVLDARPGFERDRL